MKNLVAYLASAFLFVLFAASLSSAQGFSTNPGPALPPSGVQVQASGCGNTVITESTSQGITDFNSISCNDGTNHETNGYFRAFSLDTFGITGDFEICEIQFGVESATSGSGTQPVTINLYTSDPAFPGGALTPIGSSSIQLPDQALTIVSVPVNGIAPAGSELVVEIFTPSGLAAGNRFFMGSNSAPETGPSYIQAPACGVPNPATTASVGFPNMHIVINAIGNDVLAGLVFSVSPAAAVTDIENDHTVTATARVNGAPVSGLLTAFEVTSGPNNGETSDPGSGDCAPNSDCTTDANGEVLWTYGTRGIGTDIIRVSLINPDTGAVLATSVVENTWITTPNPIPTLTEWGFIALAAIMGVAGVVLLRRRKAAV